MQRIVTHRRSALLLVASVVLSSAHHPARAENIACPPQGTRLEIVVGAPPAGAPPSMLLAGTLSEGSCNDATRNLAASYATSVRCDPGAPDSCRAVVTGLAPGEWVHRIFVIDTGQLQARRGLLLDASAGTHHLEWPLFASVFTVSTNNDGAGCVRCLREAITAAEAAAKPALIQFAPSVTGTIRLTNALPELAAGEVTIDALDAEGAPGTRTIDLNGLGRAALAIRSADNTVIGLRAINVGGDSDALVIEGAGADGNRLEQIEIVGRSLQTCGAQNEGCVIDGRCRTPSTNPPFGACGDDGIAVRMSAGAGRPNVVRGCDVSGAFDKGVKVSEFAVAHVEQCVIHNNRDGGLQATFSGQLSASENIVENNQGTNSANGIAANGPLEGSTVPARVTSHGDLVRGNSLRGFSVRSLSVMNVTDSFACGNGSIDRGRGFGITIFDSANLPAIAIVSGMAAVYNAGGGARVEDTSRADFGGFLSRGNNAFAFNGTAADSRQVNLQNLTTLAVTAGNNQWQHCGEGWSCDQARVEADDLLRGAGAGPIAISPLQANHRRQPPTIERIEPAFARAGDLVRIYGSGFDAIDGTGPNADCESLPTINTCSPLRGNCVLFDRQPAEVVAVTPTMLVVRVPATCVQPVSVLIRARYSRGAGHGTFCVVNSEPALADDVS